MTKPVELIPLKCIKCDTAIPAEPNETAWVCEQCGQAQQLGEDGLIPLKIHYAQGINPSQKGRPFWICEGRVSIDRDTYSTFGKKNKNSKRFWSQPRRFFIPAFEYPLDKLTQDAPQWLRNQPVIQTGEPVSFEPVSLSPKDVPALAEFIVMALEAERRDKVKKIQFQLTITDPELWILP